MGKCSIRKCSARHSDKLPQFSLHRFPKGEYLRKRWLDAIGKDNINPRHKNWLICSLHFEEECFNRTLGVVRFRDDAVPSLFLENNPSVSNTQDATFVPQSINSINEPSVNCRQDATFVPKIIYAMKKPPVSSTQLATFVPQSINSMIKPTVSSRQDASTKTMVEKIEKLMKKCEDQKKIIKQLNEKVRRRNKTITNLTQVLERLP